MDTMNEFPSVAPAEISQHECRDLLGRGVIGRIAVCTARGPQIFPVNYVVDGASIVFRTSPYGPMGQGVWPAKAAFEIDGIEPATTSGWSVVVSGHGHVIHDPIELGMVRAFRDPQPWAGGSRRMYVRLTWDSVTGRRTGQA